MLSGNLKHQIIVQQKTIGGTGDRGQPTYTWGTLATVQAMVEPLQGRRLELARQLVATATHKVTLRYVPGMDVKCRLMYGARVFNIGNINNVKELNFTQELTCTEQDSGAT